MAPLIDQSRLQEIKKKLKELPKVEKVKTYSGPEALNALIKDIKMLARKGYDSKEIAKLLKQEGLSASAARVKKILEDDMPQKDDLNAEAQVLATPANAEPDQPRSDKPAVAAKKPRQPRTDRKEARQ